MARKINCKDGLDYNGEVHARQIRRLLEKRDEETIKMVRDLHEEWFKKPREGFLQWLNISGNKSLSSALKRMDDWTVLLID